MFVAVFAVVCSLLGDVEVCREEFVTDTDHSPGLTFMECQARGQIGIADWKTRSQFSGDRWRVARIKCVPDRGHVIKDRT